MDIIRFKGGLGNQMFQYAFYQALRNRGRCVKASLGYYNRHPETMRFTLTEVFPNLELEYISDEEFEKINLEWRKIKEDKTKLDKFLIDYENRFFWVEDKFFSYSHEVFKTHNCTFVGYWQNEMYFRDIHNILLKKFEFLFAEEKLELLCKKLLSDKNNIAVHIRRGDYLQYPDSWGNISESEYYHRAIQFMKKKITNPFFVFFSDDIEWVKQNYMIDNAIYIEERIFEHYQSWYDMKLMSCCSHNIIANSTFSWWGAWLNKNSNKIVIAPKKWNNLYEVQEICPLTWMRM